MEGLVLHLYVAGILSFFFFVRNFYGKVPMQCFFSPFLCSPPGGLNFIDHIVGNQPDDEMVPVSDW